MNIPIINSHELMLNIANQMMEEIKKAIVDNSFVIMENKQDLKSTEWKFKIVYPVDVILIDNG